MPSREIFWTTTALAAVASRLQRLWLRLLRLRYVRMGCEVHTPFVIHVCAQFTVTLAFPLVVLPTRFTVETALSRCDCLRSCALVVTTHRTGHRSQVRFRAGVVPEASRSADRRDMWCRGGPGDRRTRD